MLSSRRFNILYVCSSLAWGGLEHFAVKLAKQLSNRGYDITFAAQPKGRIIQELRKSDIRVIPVKMLRHFDPFSVYRLIQIIRKYNIDILHVHLSRDLVHTYWTTKFWKCCPVILHRHVTSSISKKDYFHRRIYEHVSKVITFSSFVRQNMLDTCPISEESVVIIPGGVRLEEYDVPSEIRFQFRKEWKIGADAVVFGTVSRIDKEKGFEELMQAYANLAVNKNIYLVIVGEPTAGETKFASELQKLVSDLGIKQKVIFTGYRFDIPQVMSAFDVFVLPSHLEAFGYVFIEAMAARLPVIATNAGGIPDIVLDGETGFLVPPKDIKSLEEAMSNLLLDERLRKKLGSAGYTRVKAKFLESTVLDQFEELYCSLHEQQEQSKL